MLKTLCCICHQGVEITDVFRFNPGQCLHEGCKRAELLFLLSENGGANMQGKGEHQYKYCPLFYSYSCNYNSLWDALPLLKLSRDYSGSNGDLCLSSTLPSSLKPMDSCSRLHVYSLTLVLNVVVSVVSFFFFFPFQAPENVTGQLISITVRCPSMSDAKVFRHCWQEDASIQITKLLMFSSTSAWPVKALDLVRNSSSYLFIFLVSVVWSMHPSGFFFRNMSAWGFFLFPANKKIIETLPELQLCFLLERLTDPAKNRGHWKCERTCCWVCHVIPFIFFTYTTFSWLGLQVQNLKRQITRDTWKPEKSRNIFMYL